jgi:hypothetical protein
MWVGLSADELRAFDEAHTPTEHAPEGWRGPWCWTCDRPAPCDARRLLAEVRRLRACETTLAHLRRQVRMLLRMLPVDLPVPASNFRIIVAALSSEATERRERSDG